MKKITFLTYALLIFAAMTGCKQNEPASPIYTMTVEATKTPDDLQSNAAIRRILSLDGHTLNATWSAGEKVSVFAPDKKGTLSATEIEGNSCLLTGEITASPKPAVGSDLELVYYGHAVQDGNFKEQDGTLQTISDYYDEARANVRVKEISGNNIITTHADFVNQQAIVKFTLMDKETSQLLTPSSFNVEGKISLSGLTASTYSTNGGNGVLFVAIPGFEGKTLTITADADAPSKTYTYTKSGVTFVNGKYYEITVKMQKQSE